MNRRFEKCDRVIVKGTQAKGVVQEIEYRSEWPSKDEIRVVLDSKTMLQMNKETRSPSLYAYALELDED